MGSGIKISCWTGYSLALGLEGSSVCSIVFVCCAHAYANNLNLSRDLVLFELV